MKVFSIESSELLVKWPELPEWVYDMFMICLWYVYDMFMICLWYVYDMFMICLWFVYDMFMICLWYVYDMFMYIPGYLYGLPAAIVEWLAVDNSSLSSMILPVIKHLFIWVSPASHVWSPKGSIAVGLSCQNNTSPYFFQTSSTSKVIWIPMIYKVCGPQLEVLFSFFDPWLHPQKVQSSYPSYLGNL